MTWQLDAYRPTRSWWLHDPDGLHGLGHAARVLVWATLIATELVDAGTPVDIEAVRWAAALHDARRVDDWADPDHGRRAAAWLREQHRAIVPHLSAETVERVAYAIEWHVPADTAAPMMSPELVALKDGDALDRVRLARGIRGPRGALDTRYLRTERARRLVASAEALCTRSLAGAESDPWPRVRAAAIGLDVWR